MSVIRNPATGVSANYCDSCGEPCGGGALRWAHKDFDLCNTCLYALFRENEGKLLPFSMRFDLDGIPYADDFNDEAEDSREATVCI